MKNKLRLLSFLTVSLLASSQISAYSGPTKPVKAGIEKKDSSSIDINIYSESYINHTFSSAMYFQRGLRKMEMKEYEAAIIDFNMSIETYPFDAEAYIQRAHAKEFSGQKTAAEEDYDLAAYLNPKYKYKFLKLVFNAMKHNAEASDKEKEE